ncbi:hypothetical protein [Meiothermus sp.]|uniref:hypothetical protein n=1 Tax=Meiothermus sp. TaxID=1955249 RepID=UPI0021DEFE81|nr:hypothetical protein [Meiothermus sp.]GIW33751.1 MAG: hypothetical protein KatS3mg072_1084 [Meiothermus sp.]
MSIVQIQKPLEDLGELLHSMGLSLKYAVHPIEGGQIWEIKAKNGAVDWGIGVGNNRTDALASLLFELGIELTFDHPNKPYARWGRPYKGYESPELERIVWLEHIGWGNVFEIRGWRYV